MNVLVENYVSVLKNSLGFSGRSSRGEYWWFFAMNMALGLGMRLFDLVIGMPVLGIVFMLVVLLPNVAVSIRRLHDSNRSGWWMLIGLVPVAGAFALLALMVLPGTNAKNRFGQIPVSPQPFSPQAARNSVAS